MLLVVLLLPLNLLSRNSNTGRKIALASIVSLNLLASNKLASLIYMLVTKILLPLREFPSSGYCDKEKLREQGWVMPFEELSLHCISLWVRRTRLGGQSRGETCAFLPHVGDS